MLAIEDVSNKLIFDLLTLKVVSKSHVTWATSVPILVFLGLSVLELGPMYATDRQTEVRQTDRQTSDVRQKHQCLRHMGRRHNNSTHLIPHYRRDSRHMG